MKQYLNKALLAVLGVGVAVAFAATGPSNIKAAVTDPTIDGGEAVGVILTNGNTQAVNSILSLLDVQHGTYNCDGTATSTAGKSQCDKYQVFFEGRLVNVFLAYPQTIAGSNLNGKVNAFRFSGQFIFASDIPVEEREARFIQYMKEQGIKTYTIIYEQ